LLWITLWMSCANTPGAVCTTCGQRWGESLSFTEDTRSELRRRCPPAVGEEKLAAVGDQGARSGRQQDRVRFQQGLRSLPGWVVSIFVMPLPAAWRIRPPLRHPHDREIWRLAVPAFGALVAEPLFLLADSAIV